MSNPDGGTSKPLQLRILGKGRVTEDLTKSEVPLGSEMPVALSQRRHSKDLPAPPPGFDMGLLEPEGWRTGHDPDRYRLSPARIGMRSQFSGGARGQVYLSLNSQKGL